MNPQYQHYIVIVNLVVSAAIFYMSLCRLNVADTSVRVAVRGYYSLMLAGSMANGLQTVLFGQQPTIGGTVLAACAMFGMLSGLRRWVNGAPDDTKKFYCPPECRL